MCTSNCGPSSACCPNPTVVNESLCGNFNLACGGGGTLNIFTASSMPAANVTLNVFNDLGSACTIDVTITTTTGIIGPISVSQGNSQSFNASNVTMINLTGGAGRGTSFGKWCLELALKIP